MASRAPSAYGVLVRASRIRQARLELVQRLDVSAYVMVPRGSVGRLIGKGGTNIKVLQVRAASSS